MAKQRTPFEFTAPFTTMRPDSKGINRPELVGELHIGGTGYYDKTMGPEYEIFYDLSILNFKSAETGSLVPVSEWAGGTMMNLEEAHKVTVAHIRKKFGLEPALEAEICPVNIRSINRDRTEGTIHVHYTHPHMPLTQYLDIAEDSFGKWLEGRKLGKSVTSYWPATSFMDKAKHLALYVNDFLTTQSHEIGAQGEAAAA